ncbi:MAG: DUF4388 domain-containing protein [Myxococcales bacterium]|nr:DUF4388 domain-containing protein [Myxococcales bacterium]
MKRHAQDELVWIDGKGVAHPLGDTAVSRMRQREGAFRVLPAPSHVVFMRYTGEDGRRDAEDGAVVRMTGEIIGPGVMGDILSLLAQSGWRGELLVEDGVHSRSIFFESGNILAGRTTCDDERLGTILFRYGHIDEEQMASILARVAHGERFGAAAVALGFVTQEQVYNCLAKQVEEITFQCTMVSDGTYAFLEGFEEAKIPWRRAMSAFGVLMESVARLDEIRFFRARIPAGTYIPERLVGVEKVEKDLREMFAMIDGRRSVDELGRSTGLGEFEATKQIYRLAQAGHVAITAPRFRGGVSEVIDTANAILRRVHEEADLAGRGTVLRTAIASFAQGRFARLIVDAGPYEDGTFASRKVASNAASVAGEAGAYAYTADMLHDYASFALFSLGSSLGEEAERRLSHEVEPLLARLRPATSSSQLIKIVVDDG